MTALAAGLLVPFAITNRASVSLGLWPLPFLLETPLYLLVLMTLLAGVLIGAAAVWLAGHRSRRELRRQRRRAAALERELAATQAQLSDRLARTDQRLPGDPVNPRAPAALTIC